MKYFDYYYNILQYMKEFKKKNYFETIRYPNFLFLSDGKTKALITFDTLIEKKISKIDLYFDESINYYLDNMALETNLLSDIPYITKSTIAIKNQTVLSFDDTFFLKKNKIKMVKKYNLFTYDYKEGQMNCSMGTAKLKKILKFIEFLSDLINNEEQYILEAFNNHEALIANFDYKEKSYDLISSKYIKFNKYKNLQSFDNFFYDKFKDSYYCDDVCYISKFYDYNLTDDKKYFKPIIFIYYEKSKKIIYKEFEFSNELVIHNLKDYVFEIFEKEGLPTNVIVNDHFIFKELYLTFISLQIEIEFKREDHENQIKFLEKFNAEYNNYICLDDDDDYIYAIMDYKNKFNPLFNDNLLPENTDKDLELDSSLVS